ncbi:hypothetical protein [Niabella hirudinis]|uniref:hypothetical protein n=1 Tax=Niabella hirudinis TaxID=1285929 RepID=UPI003EB8EF2C
MNRLIMITLLITSSFLSCKKDKNEAGHEKKILLTRTSTTYTYDGSNMITEYAYDDHGRIVTELEDKGTTNEQPITYTYDSKGNIAARKFPARGNLRNEYSYDNMNRMTAAQTYLEDGSKGDASAYTYYSDRIEESRTYKSGRSDKQILTYTADKKNIASYKWYDTGNNLRLEITYTYANIKNPLRNVNPFTPYNSINLIEKSVVIDYDDLKNPVTDTYTTTYVAGANGYPSGITEMLNGREKSTTTYEYIVQ